MILVGMIDKHTQDRDRFDAAMHGVSLPGNDGQYATGSQTPLRRAHESIKAHREARLRGRR